MAEQIDLKQPEPPLAIHVTSGSPALERAFASLLAAELARRKLGPVVLDLPSSSSGESEARAAGARALVRLAVSVEQRTLRARGDLLGTWVNFWSGRTPTRPPSPAAALNASAEADALALSLDAARGPPPPPRDTPASGELRLTATPFGRLGGWTAALAAGDLDGDRRDEVVALTDEEILAFSPDSRVLARRALRALPFSASPCREPFGAVAVDEGARRVAYLSSQRARGESLALDPVAGFRVVERLERAPLAYTAGVEISGALVPGQNTFEPAIVSSGAVTRWTAPAAFNTLSAFSGAGGLELLAVFPSGAGTWRRGLGPDAPSVDLRGLGTASALADVDGDGTAELATTEPTHAPAPEVLRVLRAPSAAAPASGNEVRFRTELGRGRAIQLAAADLDGDGADELVVALWLPDGGTELHAFRRAR
ncbi:MAG TPA: VCBS repeat-containing protein [Myxococcaceae bacterium]|nr:VCBS repeat-containing protein [Myxococcaceae bacterium]